jgi:hypothetical protein
VRHILQQLNAKQSDQIRINGFALPLAMGLGLVMMALAATATIVAQSDRKSSMIRRENSSSNLVTEGGIARLLVQMRAPQNSILLGRNYDPINPRTNKNYLGADGVPNSNDEGTTPVDQWTNYPSSIHPCAATTGVGTPNLAKSGSLDNTPGQVNEYTLQAYRYNPTTNLATLLVEGRHGKPGSVSSTYIMVKFSVLPASNSFPGLLVSQTAYLQGRSILGTSGNLFFAYDDNDSWESRNAPYLNGVSAPGESTRSTYLNATFSGTTDGYSTDSVSGKLVACDFSHTLPIPARSSFIDKFDLNNSRTIIAPTTGINYYEASKIDLKNNAQVTIDTTLGPVYLYVKGTFHMANNAKIVNVRSDGKPSRVGDLRIFMTRGTGYEIALYNSACIQNAFLYNPESDLQLQTTGNACGINAGIEGVIWVEDLLSSRNNKVTRRDPDQDGDIIDTSDEEPSKVRVPDDLSSLSDVLEQINWPIQHKFGEIKSWQKVSL